MLTSKAMNRPGSLRVNRWIVAPPARFEDQDKLGHYHPVLLQSLYNRGLVRAGEIFSFLNRHYQEDSDPFQLADMDKAVHRIRQAVDRDRAALSQEHPGQLEVVWIRRTGRESTRHTQEPAHLNDPRSIPGAELRHHH